MIANPLQREDEIEESDVAGVCELLAAELREIQVAEHVQADG